MPVMFALIGKVSDSYGFGLFSCRGAIICIQLQSPCRTIDVSEEIRQCWLLLALIDVILDSGRRGHRECQAAVILPRREGLPQYLCELGLLTGGGWTLPAQTYSYFLTASSLPCTTTTYVTYRSPCT